MNAIHFLMRKIRSLNTSGFSSSPSLLVLSSPSFVYLQKRDKELPYVLLAGFTIYVQRTLQIVLYRTLNSLYTEAVSGFRTNPQTDWQPDRQTGQTDRTDRQTMTDRQIMTDTLS